MHLDGAASGASVSVIGQNSKASGDFKCCKRAAGAGGLSVWSVSCSVLSGATPRVAQTERFEMALITLLMHPYRGTDIRESLRALLAGVAAQRLASIRRSPRSGSGVLSSCMPLVRL